MDTHAGFALICPTCNSPSVRFDSTEGAPSSTPVRCGRCNAFRGTLGRLRIIANTGDRGAVGYHHNPGEGEFIGRG